MKKLFKILFSSLFLLACKKTYISPFNSPDLGYLVVEGVINSGPGNTTIKLSRTTQLTDGTGVMESGATAMVMDQNNQTYPLTESSSGEYMANVLNLDVNLKYMLRIVARGKEYLSDYVTLNDNTTIDSISWNYASDD